METRTDNANFVQQSETRNSTETSELSFEFNSVFVISLRI